MLLVSIQAVKILIDNKATEQIVNNKTKEIDTYTLNEVCDVIEDDWQDIFADMLQESRSLLNYDNNKFLVFILKMTARYAAINYNLRIFNLQSADLLNFYINNRDIDKFKNFIYNQCFIKIARHSGNKIDKCRFIKERIIFNMQLKQSLYNYIHNGYIDFCEYSGCCEDLSMDIQKKIYNDVLTEIQSHCEIIFKNLKPNKNQKLDFSKREFLSLICFEQMIQDNTNFITKINQLFKNSFMSILKNQIKEDIMDFNLIYNIAKTKEEDKYFYQMALEILYAHYHQEVYEKNMVNSHEEEIKMLMHFYLQQNNSSFQNYFSSKLQEAAQYFQNQK